MSLSDRLLLFLRSTIGAVVGAALSVAAGPLTADAGAGALKAAFLYNFALYTEWPSLPQTYEVCVAGRDDLGPAADNLGERQVAGRAVGLRRLAGTGRIDVPESCTILFVAASEGERSARWLDAVMTRPVLTVGDVGLSGSSAAMLQLSINDGRLSFTARQGRAQSVGLSFSAKMLRVARAVE